MASINCPKCQKVFTHPKYLSKAQDHLNTHLRRKNACDGSTGDYKFERLKTHTIPDIKFLDMTGLVESLEGNIRFCHIASFIFKFLNDLNCFAVWPNVKIHEIFYMDDNTPILATPGNFMLAYWNLVIVQQVKPILEKSWGRYKGYCNYLTGFENNLEYGFTKYKLCEIGIVNRFLRSDAYTQMKSAISSHLRAVPKNERSRTRINMGVEVPKERSILYIAPGPSGTTIRRI